MHWTPRKRTVALATSLPCLEAAAEVAEAAAEAVKVRSMQSVRLEKAVQGPSLDSCLILPLSES
jgi:hypothetical protein